MNTFNSFCRENEIRKKNIKTNENNFNRISRIFFVVGDECLKEGAVGKSGKSKSLKSVTELKKKRINVYYQLL
jgi:hypothetical protein